MTEKKYLYFLKKILPNEFEEYENVLQIIFWILFSTFVINYLIGQHYEFGIPFSLFVSLGFIQWAPLYSSQKKILVSKNKHTKLSIKELCKYELFSYFMLNFCLVIILLSLGYSWSVYLFQYIYYLTCYTIFFLLFIQITVLLIDIHVIFGYISKIFVFCLLWLSPIYWTFQTLPTSRLLPYLSVLKLNPLTYIISGIHNTTISKIWFFESPKYTLYFFSFNILQLVFWRWLSKKVSINSFITKTLNFLKFF
ncbi:hypothetical protein [Enterococcus camelliae]|uniref:ABC-2 type transporter domain-containing protein n=1 Tax=Enterococcus camelliae TaxID=453959 RepID=A0ABW5TKB7_9ENTE